MKRIGWSLLTLTMFAVASACGDDENGGNGANGGNGGNGSDNAACAAFCDKEIECETTPELNRAQCIAACATAFTNTSASGCREAIDDAATCYRGVTCEQLEMDECGLEFGLAIAECSVSGEDVCDCASQCAESNLVPQCEATGAGCSLVTGTARELCCQSALAACSS